MRTGLKLETIAGVRVLRATLAEEKFGVPAARTCGLLGNLTINALFGLPSPSGKNKVAMDTVIRIKNYRLGQITQKVAKDNKIK